MKLTSLLLILFSLCCSSSAYSDTDKKDDSKPKYGCERVTDIFNQSMKSYDYWLMKNEKSDEDFSKGLITKNVHDRTALESLRNAKQYLDNAKSLASTVSACKDLGYIE